MLQHLCRNAAKGRSQARENAECGKVVIRMLFGEKLRELRGERTQEEMARELKITKSSLAMYERNERIPRDEVKIRIAEFFGKTVQEIFFNTDEHI